MHTATHGGVTLASTTSSAEDLKAAMGPDAQITSSVATLDEPAETPPAPETGKEENGKEGKKDTSAATASPNAEIDPESDTGTPESEEQRNKGKGGFQRRIDKLTREKTQALELAETERIARQTAEARLAATAGRAPENKQAVDNDPEPQETDFTEFKKFNEAHARWAARQEFKTLREKETQAQAEAEQAEAQAAENQRLRENFSAHAQRLAEVRDQYEDWEQVAQALTGKDYDALPPAVELAIVELDNGPHVMYHLAKNPDLLTKLSGMSEVRAVAEIGSIAASLKTSVTPKPEGSQPDGKEAKDNSSPEPAPVSAAPAPIKPVGGSATKATPDPTKMPLAEYIKWRNAGGGK